MYRVIQWATGPQGRDSLRQIIDHPDLELVGVRVYSDRKNGVDAGELLKRDPIGVRCTNDVDEILALGADVVLHMPSMSGKREEIDEDVIALLRSGKNVVSVAGYIYPYAWGEEHARRFEGACEEGGSSLLGTGLNPGFLAERIGAALTAACSQVHTFRFSETFDMSVHPEPLMVFDSIGMGSQPDELTVDAEIGKMYGTYFGEGLHLIAHYLGQEVKEVTRDLEVGLATRDLEIAAGTVREGTIAATRWSWTASTTSGVELEMASEWIVQQDLPDWDTRDRWEFAIEGDPSLSVEVEVLPSVGLSRPSKPRRDAVRHAINNPAVRAIPEVVAADPGIVVPGVFGAWAPRMSPDS